MMVTLFNDFHKRSVTLRAKAGDELSQGQIARAQRALCGMTDCLCSGPLGTRGPQLVRIEALGQTRDGKVRYQVQSA